MRTGQFIQKQYEKEISRILRELEVAEKEILAETEILNLQSRIRAYDKLQEGTLVVEFQSGGVVIAMSSSKITSNNVFKTLWQHHNDPNKVKSWQKPDLEFLNQMHLSELKKCHPKMAGQLLRQLAKQALLDKEETIITRKWWEFWK